MIKEKISTTAKNMTNLLAAEQVLNAVQEAATIITKSIQTGGKLMTCGNGGSAGDAQHIAGEFVCRFYKDRRPMPCIALTTDSSVLTSIGNDYSYDQVISRQVTALGKKGDVLLGISTSGSSKNVLEAFKVAKELNITTVLLTGAVNKTIAPLSDIIINAPSTDTPFIQEMHLVIEHIICEIVEKDLNPS